MKQTICDRCKNVMERDFETIEFSLDEFEGYWAIDVKTGHADICPHCVKWIVNHMDYQYTK